MIEVKYIEEIINYRFNSRYDRFIFYCLFWSWFS